MAEMGSVLDKETIFRLTEGQPPLVEDFVDLQAQIQPNGFDLTVRSVAVFSSSGVLGAVSSDRTLAGAAEVPFGEDNRLFMPRGSYLVTLNEVVNLPLDLMALGRPRSTLLRCGVSVHTAVWDAGYHGRSQTLLVVHNPHGFFLARDSRVLQLVFFRLADQVSNGYEGLYQGENL